MWQWGQEQVDHTSEIEDREVLGRGTFGTVFANLDNTASKQLVLVRHKHGDHIMMPDHDISDSTHYIVQNNLRELVFLARFAGAPGILPVLEFVTLTWSYVDIKMPRIKQNLGDWTHNNPFYIRRQHLPVIVLQLARTLAVVHQYSILHGDLKPWNIMIDPLTFQVHIIDWGAACFSPSFTSQVGCTPQYAAPELSCPKLISPKVDVFALGLTAHYVLCKRLRTDTVLFCGNKVWFTEFDKLGPSSPDFPTLFHASCSAATAHNPTSRSSSLTLFNDLVAQFNTPGLLPHPAPLEFLEPIPGVPSIWLGALPKELNDYITPIYRLARNRSLTSLAHIMAESFLGKVPIFALAVRLFDELRPPVAKMYSTLIATHLLASLVLRDTNFDDWLSSSFHCSPGIDPLHSIIAKACRIARRLKYQLYYRSFVEVVPCANFQLVLQMLQDYETARFSELDKLGIYFSFLCQALPLVCGPRVSSSH